MTGCLGEGGGPVPQASAWLPHSKRRWLPAAVGPHSTGDRDDAWGLHMIVSARTPVQRSSKGFDIITLPSASGRNRVLLEMLRCGLDTRDLAGAFCRREGIWLLSGRGHAAERWPRSHATGVLTGALDTHTLRKRRGGAAVTEIRPVLSGSCRPHCCNHA